MQKTAVEKVGDHFAEIASQLAEIGRAFYAHGWAWGTSGNYSAVVNRDPLLVAISSSGADKADLKGEQILLIDQDERVMAGRGTPSAETKLHLTLIQKLGAGAVLHTHSVWGTILSDLESVRSQVEFTGYEMLKGLSGVTTHKHCEIIPLIDNSQEYAQLSQVLEGTLLRHPQAHGVLLRRHGLYTWGNDLAAAKRHAEVLEFLCEVRGRMHSGVAKHVD